MPATLLDGKALGQTLQAEIAANVAAFVQSHGSPPGLAAVLVGDNPASQIYVRNKRKQCQHVVNLDGAHVVIIGRSLIVGKPLALILMQKGPGANATVTVCHSRSRNLAALTRTADVVVVAIGQARFLKADMVRPGAVVIDVGT